MAENGQAHHLNLLHEGEGGDAACWLSQVCTECGAFLESPESGPCWRCGTDAPAS
jgi:hypothetical protein